MEQLPQEWEDAWQPALIQAQRETGLDEAEFPHENPFTLDEADSWCVTALKELAIATHE
jgi:hypothetical protein